MATWKEMNTKQTPEGIASAADKQPRNDLQGKKVTVMGLGLHGGGLGTIQWLLQQGALVTVTDMKTDRELKESIKTLEELPPLAPPILGGEIRLVLGKHRMEDFTEVDMVIRNPAVRRDSEYLEAARQAGVPVEMDSSLFFTHSPAKDVIGVTGSKGKTTAAKAIEWVLRYKNKELPPRTPPILGKETVAVGVDGVSPLGMLAEGKIVEDTTVVFELSSWRLEALDERHISPPVAVVTSIYREHLNTYESFEEYVETKKAIWKWQGEDGMVILNADDEEILSWGEDFEKFKELPPRTPPILGGERPLRPVPGRDTSPWQGEETRRQVWWYSVEGEIEGEGVFVREGSVWVRGKGEEVELLATDDLPVQSEHERRNLLPSLLLGWQRGLSAEDLKTAVRAFKPLPHRLETVREADGVTYVNDSAATMPDASIVALRAYKGQPVVLIAGGNDKALEFGAWARAVADSSVKEIVWLAGNITEHMQDEVRKAGSEVPFRTVSSMREAVVQARAAAQAGDVVLLSPGATSFALFDNEFDRGEQFRVAVIRL